MKNLLYLILLLSATNQQAQNTWNQIPIPVSRIDMGIAALGSKLYLAGGFVGWDYSDRIDIYNFENAEWTTAKLSGKRAWPVGLSIGDKVLFAGGHQYFGKDTVDIYDTTSGTWSVATLSEPRFNVAALGRGSLALFAGGANFFTQISYKTVDIYDAATNTWSTDTLSQGRAAMAYTIVGNKAFFAGGIQQDNVMSDRVDIFDFDTRQWDTDTLSLARGFLSGASSGAKAVFAGGMLEDWTPTDRVDIYDTETGKWSVSALTAPRGFVDNGASACGKAFFAGGSTINIPSNTQYDPSDLVDIYDADTDTWTVEHLSHPVFNHGVTTLGNKLIAAGGTNDLSDPVFDYSSMDVYSCSSSATQEATWERFNWRIFPNPSDEWFVVRDLNGESAPDAVMRLTDLQGRIYFVKMELVAEERINVADWPSGSYLLEMIKNGTAIRQLVRIIH